ncbi:hypothetical protein PITC_068290 [Penicillium italicum]|uniref:Uncharacterized protein n=1 Tax=Penicillium italicum TaxID=40296 RepID=A0A0A2LGN2_PENIT|nr:hypothetical protein PITC_068290 [Penicillium italicum]
MDLIPSAFVARPLKIVVIGAGISGIQFAHDATTSLSGIDLEIYDKNPSLGGTWYENRYPGCTCDVPSHTYQFNWAPNPSWSSLYPPAPEIHKYLEDVADRHNLRRFMNFNTKCILAQWNEDSSKWKVVLCDVVSGKEKTIFADVFVYAIGRLNNYKFPKIAGQNIFRGLQVHTANWPADMTVKDRQVIVIGNGASAIQCVAALQPDSNEQKKALQACPMRYYDFCISLEQRLAASFMGLWKGTKSQANFTSLARSFMKSKITNPDLLNALLPEFEAGCRRFTPGGHYLDALQKPNAVLITESGGEYECDILVYATGFEPYQPRFPVTGRGGRSLSEDWDREGPCESYMAAMVAEFPNFFVFNPPICPVNGSAIPGIERASDYMIRILSRLQTDKLRSVSVTQRAQRAFNQWVQSRMPHMVWSGPCKSWCKWIPNSPSFTDRLILSGTDKNDNGKVVVPWPGTVLHYYAATEIVRWEDFDLVYENPDDKYASFGNGVTIDGFVPNHFPWVHPPTDFGKPERNVEPASQVLAPSNVLYRLTNYVLQLLGVWSYLGEPPVKS